MPDAADYSLNIDTLEDEILKMKSKIRDVRYTIAHPESGDEGQTSSYEDIRAKIKEVNEMRLKFCQKKQEYDQKYRQVEVAVSEYEFKMEAQVNRHEIYIAKVNQLRELESRFVEMRQNLERALA